MLVAIEAALADMVKTFSSLIGFKETSNEGPESTLLSTVFGHASRGGRLVA
jgi:hypothetical protein